MRKLTALLASLCLCLCLSPALPAAAEDFDFSYFRERDNIFAVDQEEEDGVVYTFVESTLPASSLSFQHAHESDTRYSYTNFDLLFAEGSKSVCYPRLWVVYCADEFLDIDKVTFYVDGQSFTFLSLKDEDLRTDDEKGCMEELPIIFGKNSLGFLDALGAIQETCATADELREHRIVAVLHGKDEELTVTLSENFLLDYFLIIVDGYMNTVGMATIDSTDPTPMITRTEAAPPDPIGAAGRVEDALLRLFGLDD